MSNWESLKAKMQPPRPPSTTPDTSSANGHAQPKAKKRKRSEISEAVEREREARAAIKGQAERQASLARSDQLMEEADKAKFVALDCEMVGVGVSGRRSALARVTVVNYEGQVIYDEHVRPPEKVTDFRTHVSGVKAKHLKDGLTLKQCITQVGQLIKGKMLVGHALHNDLQVLMLTHPVHMIRDTAKHAFYMKARGPSTATSKGGKLRPRRLKDLAKEFLGMDIQGGQHDSGEDARAAMLLYRYRRVEWEKELIKSRHKFKVRSKTKATTGTLVTVTP